MVSMTELISTVVVNWNTRKNTYLISKELSKHIILGLLYSDIILKFTIWPWQLDVGEIVKKNVVN